MLSTTGDFAACFVNRVSPESGSRTALAVASAKGHVEVVRLLLRNGADAYIHDDQDLSPLMLAARGGHVDVIRVNHFRDPCSGIALTVSPMYSGPYPIVLSHLPGPLISRQCRCLPNVH